MLPGIFSSLMMAAAGAGSASSHTPQFFYAGSTANNGGIFSGTNILLTSPDGSTWTSRTAPWVGDVNGVAFGGGKYVMVGNDNVGLRVATSPDGVTWTSGTPPWTAIVLGPGFPNYYDTNANAGSWAQSGLVAYGNNMFVFVGRERLSGGTLQPVIASSPDGVTWTKQTVQVAGAGLGYWNTGIAQHIVFANGRFMVCGWDDSNSGTRVMSSVDGITWANKTVLSWGGNYTNARITYGAGKWICAGSPSMSYTPNNSGSAPGSSNPWGSAVSVSLDNGTTWADVTTPSWDWVTDLRYYAGKFYLTGETFAGSTAGTGNFMQSADGVAWSRSTPLSAASVNGISYGNGVYLIIGGGSATNGSPASLASSTDGSSFTVETGVPVGGNSFLVAYV
jgi:hypothetical protein